MKTVVAIIVTFFAVLQLSAQIYVSTAVKIATKSDAYPYGAPVEANVSVLMDIENQKLEVSNFPDYCFNLHLISETCYNNGKLLRLTSICPENRKCYVNAYIENDQIVSLEIKFVNTSYKYQLAQK